MTKAYTIPFLINYVRGTSSTDWSSATTSTGRVNYSSVLSPVGGSSSLKIKAFNGLLGGSKNVSAIVHGSGRFSKLGLTPRARLLKALKLRSSGVVL